MKTLDLNIVLNEPVKEDDTELKGYEVAIRWIGLMIERALNKPDPKTMRPTVAVNMDTQRKYYRVMNALEAHKNGIAIIEDDDFSFLDRKFNQAEISVQKDINLILVEIDTAINKAKVEKKEGDK